MPGRSIIVLHFTLSFRLTFPIGCFDGETDHIQIQRILASEGLMIYKVHVERSEEDHKPSSVNAENHRRFRCASSSVDAAAVISVVAPSTQVQSGIPALESTSGEGTRCPCCSIPIEVR